MNNSNVNPADLPSLVQRIAEKAAAEGLHMRSLGDYAREVKLRRGKTLTQAILLNFTERLDSLADCLVLQTDPAGNPRVVYVVGAETAEGTSIILSDEEYQQILNAFEGTPIPLTWMRLVLAEDGSFGEARLGTLDLPSEAPEAE